MKHRWQRIEPPLPARNGAAFERAVRPPPSPVPKSVHLNSLHLREHESAVAVVPDKLVFFGAQPSRVSQHHAAQVRGLAPQKTNLEEGLGGHRSAKA